MDKSAKRLLGLCSDKVFEFMKTHAQERDAFDLYRAGLLERQWQVYSVKRGGRTVEMRWAYRRSAAGRLALQPTTGSVAGPT